jgi:hypothetical protein
MTQLLTATQRASLDDVTEILERLNKSICNAVDSGLSIELQRASRHHAGGGFWGDIMKPCVVKRAE